LTAKHHCGDVPAYGQYLTHDFRHMIDRIEGHLESVYKTAQGFHLARASLLREHNTRALCWDCAHRTLNGSPARFARSMAQNSAIGCNHPFRQSGTLFRTVCNAFLKVRQPFFAAIGTSLCILRSTTLKWLGQLYTRSHKSRSVSVFLP
jgi:hypothetical protein